jgi:hypothetical protein
MPDIRRTAPIRAVAPDPGTKLGFLSASPERAA